MPDVLVLGYSSIARRRVIPALEGLDQVGRVHVASVRSTPDGGQIGKLGSVFGSYDDALATAGADMVYVSTVNSDHLPWALAAIESGHHVVVDKPACLSADDAERLVGAAERTGRVVAETTVYASHPLFDVLREQVDLDHGARATGLFSIPPLPPDNFRYQPDLGGGALLDLGPYAVSIGRVLFGSEPSSITGAVLTRAATGVETAFSMLADHGAGRSVVGHFGFDTQYVNRLSVLDHRRLVEADRVFTSPPDLRNELRVTSGQEQGVVPIPAADAFAAFIGSFIHDVATGSAAHHHEALLADARSLQRLREAASRHPVDRTEGP